MGAPLVSILMTAFNREKYIGEAIESVLASTYRNWELIINDDQSKDKTVEIARRYAKADNRIKVFINEKNLGDYPNRNKTATYATGEYLKFLDSDDLIYKYGLEAFVDFMEQDKEVALGISNRLNNTIKPFPVIMSPAESVRHHFLKEGFLDCAPTGTIIRRSCFEALGGFSGKRMIGDFEFGLKIAAKYKVMLLPPGLFFWRNHGEQEVYFGINNNMYPRQFEEVMVNEFETIPEEVLTAAEKQQILKNLRRSNKIAQIKGSIKKIINPRK
jgi:glycosyltransferase involved in cell wall biosynthesis